MTEVIGGNGYNKKAVVFGGNGFIGHHLCRRLKQEGYYVLSVDIKECEYGVDHATDIWIDDLRLMYVVEKAISNVDVIYQLAADMGGCMYVFTGDHDADIMRNSAQINMNLCDAAARINPKVKIFYSSSACMYPQELQRTNKPGYFMGTSEDHIGLKESMAYPASPDSEYGWEKLFSERLYLAYARNYGLNVRIARFHNIYGPEGTYKPDGNGVDKSKAPARICRKVAEAIKNDPYNQGNTSIDVNIPPEIEVWGDGQQTRSFLYIDDCIDAVRLLMQSDFKDPINIGSEEMVTIEKLWDVAIEISGKSISKKFVPMPPKAMGVRGRNSNNDLIREKLNWNPRYSLREGMQRTFEWVNKQVNENR